jgi:CubicO group peptidase (beta-lactamase class C family)
MDKALIDIDAPMQIYTERFPAPLGEQITPRMIAAHTSGIRHYQGLEFYMKDSFPTTDEVCDSRFLVSNVLFSVSAFSRP